MFLSQASVIKERIFSSAGWAIHISWSKYCLCVCAWMLTRVAQIINAAYRDLQSCTHKPANERWRRTQNHASLYRL